MPGAAQRATTVLSRAPGGSRVYTLLRDGSVASFDPQDDYALSDPLENPSEDDLGEPPHLFQLVAISDVELVAADLDTAYRYRVGSDGLEELSRTGLGGTLADLFAPITALLTMGIILFLTSVVLFGKKNLVQK